MRRTVVAMVVLLGLACLCASPVLAADKADTPKRGSAAKKGGPLFTLNNKEVDIREALQMIARVADCNLVFGKEVRGKISVELKDVPAKVALEAICLANGYVVHHYDMANRIFLVVAADKAEQIMRIQMLKKRMQHGAMGPMGRKQRMGRGADWNDRSGPRPWREKPFGPRDDWDAPALPKPGARPSHEGESGDDWDDYDEGLD